LAAGEVRSSSIERVAAAVESSGSVGMAHPYLVSA
jgi:hypothetical protein